MHRFFLRHMVETDVIFEDRTVEELEALVETDTYNGFKLTGAIRPGWDVNVTPTEGYRHEIYSDPDDGESIPVLMTAISAEKMMDVFMQAVERLAYRRRYLDVMLMPSHEDSPSSQYHRNVDATILQSILWDYENVLLDDGFFSIAVIDRHRWRELQLTDEKLLLIYGVSRPSLLPFERILVRHSIRHKQDMAFITEDAHVHISNAALRDQCDQLCQVLT